MPEASYEWVDHTADFRLVGRAPSQKALFALVAEAMFELIVDRSNAQPVETVTVEVSALDAQALMVQWLNELLYRFEADGLLPLRFEIKRLTGTYLEAEVSGDRFDPDKHEVMAEIKAATYHHLQVARHGDEWHAEVVFDT